MQPNYNIPTLVANIKDGKTSVRVYKLRGEVYEVFNNSSTKTKIKFDNMPEYMSFLLNDMRLYSLLHERLRKYA